ncbi:MAG: hypothetical protein U0354_20605 [Candidatus Sericytochromatia bacterium]
MAVAAALGGASPNFDPLYNDVARLSRRLSIASAREVNDPGQTLQLKIKDLTNLNSQPQVFDAYMKPFYSAEGQLISYNLFYKDGNNDERKITDFNLTAGNPPTVNNQYIDAGVGTTASFEYSINGQVLNTNNQLFVDVQSGRIRFNSTVNGSTTTYSAGAANSVDLGIVKFEGATGLDVGIINDRISQINLAIEALNKVLLVAAGNIDKAVDLRI